MTDYFNSKKAAKNSRVSNYFSIIFSNWDAEANLRTWLGDDGEDIKKV
jgi:hypothetical protein